MRHKHADLIIAWANGAQIQHLDLNDIWKDCNSNSPTWSDGVEYRIKPESKPDVVLYGADGWLKNWGSQFRREDDCIKLIFDGETGKLKSAEVL